MNAAWRPKVFVIVVGAIGLATAGWLFLRDRDSGPKNVVLIVVDALRADRLSAFGYSRSTTGEIDGFAAGGSVFDQAFCTLPSTQPSMASMFTSLYPASHGIQRHGVSLGPGAITLAELLGAKGWDTAAVVGASNLDTIFGFSQGFFYYEDHLGSKENLKVRKLDNRKRWQRSAEEVNQVVFHWLENRRKNRPFFLLIHYFDPHAPYEPPAPYGYTKTGVEKDDWSAGYDAEVAYVDDNFGKLIRHLDSQGILKNTLVILTSDHGENLGEHGWQGHSQRIHDEAVRIPLILSGPGIPKGKKYPQLVQNVDIAPTILDYLGIPVPQFWQGMSVRPAFRGELLRTFVHLEITKRPENFSKLDPDWEKYPEIQWGIRTPDKKLIWSSDGKHELYDLKNDPLEQENMYPDDSETAVQLQAIGEQFRSSLKSYQLSSGKPQPKPEQNDPEEAMRALGYLN